MCRTHREGVKRPLAIACAYRIARCQELGATVDEQCTWSLKAQIAEAQLALSRGAEAGQKKAAAAALITLRDLLASGPDARSHGALLRGNGRISRERLDHSVRALDTVPTWDSVLARVLFYLSLGNKLVKADVEKLRLLVGAAIGAGALSAKMELKIFCYLCRELADQVRTPLRADKQSAHPECIGVLLQLTNGRPQLLTRLAPCRLRQLLESSTSWITSQDGSSSAGVAVQEDGTDIMAAARISSAAGIARPSSSRPHLSIAALPQLMVQYAQLLHHLVLAWQADMPVLEPSPGDADRGGPFFMVLSFLGTVCDMKPPHLSKMANLVWSATLHAILTHGPDAMHEVAAFGLEPPVHATLLSTWHVQRGTALADTFASFVRVHLACVSLCGVQVPTSYTRQLSGVAHDELVHGTKFKHASVLLHTRDTSEQTWRARSLLQLIADIFALHHPQELAVPPSGSRDVEGGGKRRRTAETKLLYQQQLSDALCCPATRTAAQSRWLLLLGTICEHEAPVLALPLRARLRGTLCDQLPTADDSIGYWDHIVLVAWCLGNLAAAEPPRAAHAEWSAVWTQLHMLAVFFSPTPRTMHLHEMGCSAGSMSADSVSMDSVGVSTGSVSSAGNICGGSLSAGSVSIGGASKGSSPIAGWRRACFVDLAARCMRVLLTQRLLLPEAFGGAIEALGTSSLFASHHALPSPSGLSAEDSSTSAAVVVAQQDCASAYLRTVAELAFTLCEAVCSAQSSDRIASSHKFELGSNLGLGERCRLVCWLCERLLWTPVQLAFESTSPWRCALQLRAQRTRRANATEHVLLRTVLCHVVAQPTRRPSPGKNNAAALAVAPAAATLNASCSHSSYHPAGINGTPPIPLMWVRRFASPGVACADIEEDEESAEWKSEVSSALCAMPSHLMSPGVVQLETFLRYADAFAAPAHAAEQPAGRRSWLYAADAMMHEPAHGQASAHRHLHTRPSQPKSAVASHGSDEKSKGWSATLNLTISALRERRRWVYAGDFGNTMMGVGSPRALRYAAHMLRVVECMVEVLDAAKSRSAVASCFEFVGQCLRDVAGWMRRALPSPPLATAGDAAALAAAKVWARAHRMLLALRSSMLSLDAFASNLSAGLSSMPLWFEAPYLGTVSEPPTLSAGATLLCKLWAQRKMDFVAGVGGVEATAPGCGSGSISNAMLLDVNVEDAIDVIGIESVFGARKNTETGTATATTVVSLSGSSDGRESSTVDPVELLDGGVGETLHVALDCVNLMARFDSRKRIWWLSGASAGLGDMYCARLSTRVLALHAVSTCSRATPDLRSALKVASLQHVNDLEEAGAGPTLCAALHQILQVWEAPANALLVDAKKRVTKAASRVRKIKRDGSNTAAANAAANFEASVAAAAAACDCCLRRALVTAAAFARCVPYSLPLGGSVRELRMLSELWQLLFGHEDNDTTAVVAERGGHTLGVRDRQCMLPLTPAARFALADALDAHVTMHARLYESLRFVCDSERAPYRHVPFVDGSTLDAAIERFDNQLLNGLHDGHWAVRDVVVNALATFVHTTIEEDHGFLLTDALNTLLTFEDSRREFGVPRAAFLSLKLGGGRDGLGKDSESLAAVAPTPYISPAFEIRISAVHAIRVVGQCSSTCRAAALLLLVLAHGPDAISAVQSLPIAASTAEEGDQPPRAVLRCAAVAALRSIALFTGQTTGGLLRKHVLRLLVSWLQLELNLSRMPQCLFGYADDASSDGLLHAFLARSLIPLTSAAVLASNGEVVVSAAQTLGLPGGAQELLRDALPQVLAHLLNMHGRDNAEREAYTRGIDFLSRQLAPQTLLGCAATKLADVVTEVLQSATSSPPKQLVAHLRSVIIAAPDSHGSSAVVVSKRPLVHTLRGMCALRLVLLVLKLRQAVALGEGQLASFELLLDKRMLAVPQLLKSCVSHLLQAALLPAAGSGTGVSEHTRACILLEIVHRRLDVRHRDVRGSLLPQLLCAALPIAPRSEPVQNLLHTMFALGRDDIKGGAGANANEMPREMATALQSVAPYECLISETVRGLRELRARLVEGRVRHEDRADDFLTCEAAAPAHRLGVHPTVSAIARGCVESNAILAGDVGASASELEAHAAVSQALTFLGDSDTFNDARLAKWLDANDEENDVGAGGGADVCCCHVDEDQEARCVREYAIDGDEALGSGGDAWCAWNVKSFPSDTDYERHSPYERLRRWLLRLAAAQDVSKPLAQLIGVALGLCTLPRSQHTVRLGRALRFMPLDPSSDSETGNASAARDHHQLGCGTVWRHVHLLCILHEVLVSADTPPSICAVAARVLTSLLARECERRAASAVEEVLPLCTAVHIKPFLSAKELRVSPNAFCAIGRIAPCDVTVDGSLPAHTQVWASHDKGTYGHAHWLSRVVAPLLNGAMDPLLAACAPLASTAPHIANSLLDEALTDVASQTSHGAALAAALHAALHSSSVACPDQKICMLLRACTDLLRGRSNYPGTHSVARGLDIDVPSVKFFSSPFHLAADVLGLADRAAAQAMHRTALYFIERHHTRAATVGDATLPDRAATPRAASGAQHVRVHVNVNAQQVAFLYSNPTHANAAADVAAQNNPTVAPRLMRGSWLSRSLAVLLGDLGMRSYVQAFAADWDDSTAAKPTTASSVKHGEHARSCVDKHASSVAIAELRCLGSIALMRALSVPDESSGGATLMRMQNEIAWCLGQWWSCPGEVLTPSWRGSRCHATVASALPQVGCDDGTFASLQHSLSCVQQRLALRASGAHPEAAIKLTTTVAKLQLCGAVHEFSGALLAALPVESPNSWPVRRSDVLQARRYSAWRARKDVAGGGARLGPGAVRDPACDGFARWARCQNRRLQQQHEMFALSELIHTRQIVALHGAILRQVHPSSHIEQLDVIVSAMSRALQLGELEAAHSFVRHAAEASNALVAVSDAGVESSDGGGRSFSSATWACRWASAKLRWAGGGEHRADALVMAKRLQDEFQLANSSDMNNWSVAAVTGAQLQWEVLRQLGGWMDELRCRSQGEIETKMLGCAVQLAEALGEWAVSQALLTLARFHERQSASLHRIVQSSSFAKLASARARAAQVLRTIQREIAQLRTSQSGRDTKRRRALELHERELVVLLQREEFESSIEQQRVAHLKAALDNYLLCLRRATRDSETSRSAASGTLRVWTRNREQAHLSAQIEQDVLRGLADKIIDFVPLSFQITARLESMADVGNHSIDPLLSLEAGPSQSSTVEPRGAQFMDETSSGKASRAHFGGSRTSAAAFQTTLSMLTLEVSSVKEQRQQVVLHQLVAELAHDGPAEHLDADAAVRHGRRQAAQSMVQKIRMRSDKPVSIDAVIAVCIALRRLAHCPNPERMLECGNGRVAIADALADCGIEGAYDVSQLGFYGHSIDSLPVPPAVTPAVGEGIFLKRFLPTYIALTSIVAPSHRLLAHRAKLLWCEDEIGARHPLLLKAGPTNLDTRRDALMQQFIDEFNTHLVAEPRTRQRRMKVLGRRVLPLAPSSALYEWRPRVVSLDAFVNAEHAAAYFAGRERLDLVNCEADITAAHAIDARRVANLCAPVSGAAAAAIAVCRIGPSVRVAWARLCSGTSPLLHLFLLGYSLSAEAWLACRMQLTRSLATSSISGWLLGLGERAPHRILLDKLTAEVLHIGTQAIFQQRPAAIRGECSEHGDAGITSGVTGHVCSPTPPPMPFRLTREFVDALGPVGVHGSFQKVAQASLRIAQGDHVRAALLTLIEVFVDEPMLGWAAALGGMGVPWTTCTHTAVVASLDAELAVLRVHKRLQPGASGETTSAGAHTFSWSVESRVRQLISHATAEEVLASQLPSWRAWL